ncbi:NAD(P)-binding protein [Xylariaceae sp. FL0804]|nr:NAD(P)-binding protein [Xylariaceae sp. FL0804]
MGYNPRPLDGKLAIISGASRGIGGAVAENLASKGCNLVVHYNSDLSRPDADKLAGRLSKEHGIRAEVIQADFGTDDGPSTLVDRAREAFAADEQQQQKSPAARFQVDILINNAGMVHNAVLGEITAADFFRVYRLNALAPLLLMQAVMPHLPTDRSGRVVNVSSVSSQTGFPDQSIYGGTKAALESCTRSWARQLVEHATVNAINPGPVKTEMWDSLTDEFRHNMHHYIKLTPGMQVRGDDDEATRKAGQLLGGRPAMPAEIAGIVGMLCSAESAWCTGQVICANGGLRMSN